MVVEDQFVGEGGIGEVATRGVQEALGLAGAAGGVEDEERILGPHPLLGAGRSLLGGLLVEPVVAAGLHGDITVGAASHQHRLYQGHAFDGAVHGALQGNALPAPHALVGGHHHLAAGIHDAVADGLCREAAEDHGVDSANAGAGQHGVNQLRDHGHVEADPIALFHAVVQQYVGHTGHVVFELAIGDVGVLARFILGPDEGSLVPQVRQVPVHAVEAGIDAAAGKPGKIHLLVIRIEDRLPRVEPREGLGLLAPEPLRIVQREAVEALVLLHGLDVGPLADVRFNGVEVFGHGLAPCLG